MTEAEHTLRTALKQSPRDPSALGLLGVVLDAQKRFDEAEGAYQEALALQPRSPAVLNNLGNHYLAQGRTEKARAAYLNVVAIEPSHANANLQLAQLSVSAKQGAATLHYLDRLPQEQQISPAVAILRAQALHWSRQTTAAEALLEEVEQRAGSDPRVAFSVGMAFFEWQRYAEAEKAFTHSLDADPASFDILYNLGLSAQHAGHLDRALGVYQVALKQRPNDPDCLYNLASIYLERDHADQAITLLLDAHNAAPERSDILLAMSRATAEMGFYADAASALNQYLKLRPNDEVARRERGFCLVRSAKLDEGLKDLSWYTQKHPGNARGFYELSIAETVRERDKALQHLDRALTLDPELNAARYARAILYYQEGKTEESIADLKLSLKTEPDDYRALDALGQDYARLKRDEEAAEVLQRAWKLAPKDPKILVHYSRVLVRLNRKAEAEQVLADFRKLGPEEGRRRPYRGLLEYLKLPPEEQYAKYMTSLRRSIATRPEDPVLRVQLGKALLYAGKTDEGVESFRSARKLTSDPNILAACGKVLVSYEQFRPAREFLEPAVAASLADADAQLDLAIATFHTAGPEAGLRVLDETPPAQRQGDYFLLRAQLLDAMEKAEEAAQALNRGLEAAPTRSDLYLQAAMFLIKHAQYRQAVRLLDQANRFLPDSPDLQLLEAIAYELLQQHEDSLRTLTRIESRWPEWAMPYMIHGIMLTIRLRSEQARAVLENALALGANNGITYYYLALAIVNGSPGKVEEAQQAISQALQLDPDDVYIQALAGRIASMRKDYQMALHHLNIALHAWPEMIEAHQNLAAVYRALGEREKSARELEEIVRIKQNNRTAEQEPPLLKDSLLFAVAPPAKPAR